MGSADPRDVADRILIRFAAGALVALFFAAWLWLAVVAPFVALVVGTAALAVAVHVPGARK
jgi:hypothetical protein